jgi:acetyltransferase-like isoleucine patch superfamily enzyme
MIGNNFTCNSRDFNPIGRNTKTYLVVGPNASLTIGNHVGISNTAIICHKSITIGSFVKIGGGVVIYDTDFHSLDYMDRRNSKLDFENKINSGIVIEDDVFIGAHSIILKGVTIGKGSIIGAGSVITKSIPPFEIWGGNPAKFIRKIDFHKTGMQYAI